MRDVRKIYIFGVLLLQLLLGNCSSNGKYSDFETDESGLKYKFIEKGNSKETINPGDYVEMELVYKNQNDSVLFNSKELRTSFRMPVNNISHKGGCFENAVFLCNPGDKISFVLNADSFYNKTQNVRVPLGVKKRSDLNFEMKLIRKLGKDEVQLEHQKYLQQLKEQEDLLIKNYISENDIKEEPKSSGLYMIFDKKGTGRKTKAGNILTVHYIGKFIDGKVFDSSYRRNEPFDFELGGKQVIDAWEEACSVMREGDKVTLIAPSKLAYGQDGFGKLIPPYSPLIFEIELIAIN